MMTVNRKSGILFFIFTCVLSLSSALNTYGTLIEQFIEFASQFITFFLIIALYCKWKCIEVFSSRAVFTIAISYPIIVIIRPLYMAFEYSDQTMQTSFLLAQGLDLWLSLFVAAILLTKEKNESNN